MDIRRVGGALGAVVNGVALRQADAEQVGAIRAALSDHQVLVFPGQEMSEDEQLAVSARFGEVIADRSLRPTLTKIENKAGKPPATDEWHADSTFLANPPAIGLLRGVVIPEYGGDTMWVSLRAAHRALSGQMQEFAATLSAEHEINEAYRQAARDYFPDTADSVSAFTAVHPLVIRAPGAAEPSLFLSPRYLKSVVGVPRAESDALLGYFNRLLDTPMYQFRWRWTPDDIVMWDERSVNHRGIGDHFHDHPQHRLMYQVLVLGEAPIPAAVVPALSAVS